MVYSGFKHGAAGLKAHIKSLGYRYTLTQFSSLNVGTFLLSGFQMMFWVAVPR